MSERIMPLSVLIVASSGTDKLIRILDPSRFSPVSAVESGASARRRLADTPADIIIINTPLSDEFGQDLAADLIADSASGVLLLVSSDNFESISYKMENLGILSLVKPTSRSALEQAMGLLSATVRRLKSLESKASALQSRIDDIRIVNRAKFLLLERLGMTEPDAHRYIEKQAMDTCTKRRVIAENIIRTYET